MKQKAKIYKGKRIVIGDKNLVTKNEIHVNDIPQEDGESGGGDAPSGGGRGMKYYDISGNSGEQRQMIIAMAGILGKISGQRIMPIPQLLLQSGGTIIPQITCVAIVPDAEIVTQEQQVLTIETVLDGLGAPLSSLLEITKEEFYTL